MRKVIAVARKEFRQIVRDRRTLLTLLFVPAFFLLLYGYALNFDIRHVRIAIDDRDHTPQSRSLAAAFRPAGPWPCRCCSTATTRRPRPPSWDTPRRSFARNRPGTSRAAPVRP